MKTFVLNSCLILALFSALPLAAQTSSSSSSSSSSSDDKSDALIEEMLELTKMMENFEPMMEQMMTNVSEVMEQQGEDMGEFREFMEVFMAEFENENFESLIEEMKGVYKEHLDEESLQGIVDFYKSDAGRSLIEKQAAISSELMNIGMQWGVEVGTRITEMLEDPNSELNQRLQELERSIEEGEPAMAPVEEGER